jgi:predicted amidohydrolase
MEVDLFAIQPYMTLADYATHSAFYRKIRSLIEAAERMRQPNNPALVVFPEDLATFLVIADRVGLLDSAKTMDEAFSRIGARLLPNIVYIMAQFRIRSLKRAFFTWAAPQVWRIWYQTMTDLAKTYQMTIVAGSALLPENRFGLNTAHFAARSADIYNLSFTANPLGQVVYHTKKVNLVPTQEDVLDLTPGPLEPALASYSWNGIPLATTICYDGFSIPHTTAEPRFSSLIPLLDTRGVRLVAQPSANPWPWQDRWAFSGAEDQRSRKQQWLAEGSLYALRSCQSIEVVINPQILIQMLDIHFDGSSMIIARNPSGEVQILSQSADFQADPAAEEILHATWNF